MTLVGPDLRRRCYGRGFPAATVHILDREMPRRLVLDGDLALGEGYAEGGLTVAGDDLGGLLTLLLLNLPEGTNRPSGRGLGRVAALARRMQQFNPIGRARRNVRRHYDLPDALYDLFLDSERHYSCAYFREPHEDLDRAQADKVAHIARKLLLKPGMRVLDIGCGWGGTALALARDHGVSVLGVTLSERQLAIALSRAEAAGLSDRVQFRLMDYRQVTGQFDRIVSIGMFEHVGTPQFDTFFRQVRDRLAEDGVALVHAIGRPTPPGSTGSFIRKHIFPGGYVPALSETMAAVERQGLLSTDIEVWRLHYAQTLRLWRHRFEVAVAENPWALSQKFVRLWRYYLTVAEVGFRQGRQVVYQIQLARKQDAVPLTRDYMAPPARQTATPAAAGAPRGPVPGRPGLVVVHRAE